MKRYRGRVFMQREKQMSGPAVSLGFDCEGEKARPGWSGVENEVR